MSNRLASASRVVAISLALLAGCSSLKGKESGERYTAPDGLFSVPVPKLARGQRTEDRVETNPETNLRAGAVAFTDDFASVRAIEYDRIPPGYEATEDMMRSHLHDKRLPYIQKFSPQARVAREEPVRLSDGTSAWFAVLEIPEGSNLIQKSPQHPDGRRLDSVRGFLLVGREDLFLVLNAADDFGRKEGEGATPEETEKLKSTLLALYSSIVFNPSARAAGS